MAETTSSSTGLTLTPYQKAIKKMEELQDKKYAEVQDLSGPIQPGVVESGKVTQEEFDEARGNKPGLMEGLDFSKAMQPSGGGMEGTLGGLLMTSPDPFMKAAGFGLATFGQVQQERNQRALDQFNLDRNKAQMAINNARRLTV
jgi:hypothetical protein